MLPDHGAVWKDGAGYMGWSALGGKEPCSSALHGTVASADAACMANTPRTTPRRSPYGTGIGGRQPLRRVRRPYSETSTGWQAIQNPKRVRGRIKTTSDHSILWGRAT